MTRFPATHPRDALFLARCFYLVPLLVLWPIKSPIYLAVHGQDHFHPPLGPFLFLSGYPAAIWIRLLEFALFVLFAFWLTGRGGWKVGGAVTLILTTLSGLVYCSGKVDHDFAILLAPLLLTLPRPRESLAITLAIYYASSGLAKTAGCWLDPSTQSSLSWALYYQDVLQPPALLLGWTLKHCPGWFWEFCDLATVAFELAVPLALIPRFRKFILPAIPIFHLGVLLLFGIDFSRLLLLYLPLTLLVLADEEIKPLHVKTKQRLTLAIICALILAFLYRIFTGLYWKIPLPVNLAGLFLFALLTLTVGSYFLRSWLREKAKKAKC